MGVLCPCFKMTRRVKAPRTSLGYIRTSRGIWSDGSNFVPFHIPKEDLSEGEDGDDRTCSSNSPALKSIQLSPPSIDRQSDGSEEVPITPTGTTLSPSPTV